MSKDADIAKLGAAKTDGGIALTQAVLPITDDVSDTETFGEIAMFQALGITSLPWPADEDSHAEGVILRNVGNLDAVCVGARDTRTASIVGNGKPGDTFLHSTGPNLAAQVQCKEEKRQVVVTTKDERGKDHMFMIDAANRKCQIAAFGAMIQIDDGVVTVAPKGGKCMIQASGDTVSVAGKVILGGTKPIGPLAYFPPGAAVAVPLPGVFAGTG